VINYDDTGTIEITAKNVDSYRQEKAWAYKFEKEASLTAPRGRGGIPY
jgi:hypothetical protein